jgi:hypothetical protein
MSDVDLNAYDLEFAELVHLARSQDRSEISLVIRCPKHLSIIGSLTRVFRHSRYGQTDYRDLQLTFIGVSHVDETLFSQGHQLAHAEPDRWPDALNKGNYEVRDVSPYIHTEDGGRFHLEVEGFFLDFNYLRCLMLEGEVMYR